MYLLEASLILAAIAFEYAIESIIFKKPHHIPVGFGLVAFIVIVARKYLKQMPPLLFSLFAAALVTVFECMTGQIGRALIHGGRHSWYYDSIDCNGYIDWKVSVMWFGLIHMAVLIIDMTDMTDITTPQNL